MRTSTPTGGHLSGGPAVTVPEALTFTAVVVTAAWFLAAALGADLPAWLAWAPSAASGLSAAAACWHVGARRSDPRARAFWRYAAVGLAVATAGSVARLAQYAAGEASPSSPLAQAVYLSGSALVVWAVVRLPHRASVAPGEKRRLVVDATVVFLGVGALVWHVSFRHADQWSAAGGWQTVVTITGLGVLAAAAFTKVSLVDDAVVGCRVLRRAALGVAAGAALAAAAPSLVAAFGVRPVVSVVPAVALGFAVAARLQRRGGPGPRAAAATARVAPYLPIAALDVLLLFVTHRAGQDLMPVAVAVVLLTTAVAYRQVSSARDAAAMRRRAASSARDLRQARDQLAHRDRFDALTGAASRQEFGARLTDVLAGGEDGVVALLDVDDFKAVNDRFTHAVGDELLTVLVRRIAAAVRPGDLVGRLGGDEFAVLLRGISAAHAVGAVTRVRDRLVAPVHVDARDLLVDVSVGVTPVTAGADAAELLRRADVALHHAKTLGEGRIVGYDPEMDRRLQEEAWLGPDLRSALARDEFHLVYQPVVRLPDGRPAGVEALVRWRHPARGLVPPVDFIPFAERTGLIISLGRWVLREACRQAGQWLRDVGAAQPWKVSVNVSARQLREPGFAAEVAAALAAAELPAERLMVEVTETAIFDSEVATATLREIAALGVALALDDFGTGQSSLGLLRTAPVDVLKVDKSFVDDLDGEGDAVESTIVTATLYIANGLRLGAVAEGVETPLQARRLHELGYQLAQGYHFARPLPAEEIGVLLGAAAPVWQSTGDVASGRRAAV